MEEVETPGDTKMFKQDGHHFYWDEIRNGLIHLGPNRQARRHPQMYDLNGFPHQGKFRTGLTTQPRSARVKAVRKFWSGQHYGHREEEED